MLVLLSDTLPNSGFRQRPEGDWSATKLRPWQRKGTEHSQRAQTKNFRPRTLMELSYLALFLCSLVLKLSSAGLEDRAAPLISKWGLPFHYDDEDRFPE